MTFVINLEKSWRREVWWPNGQVKTLHSKSSPEHPHSSLMRKMPNPFSIRRPQDIDQKNRNFCKRSFFRGSAKSRDVTLDSNFWPCIWAISKCHELHPQKVPNGPLFTASTASIRFKPPLSPLSLWKSLLTSFLLPPCFILSVLFTAARGILVKTLCS